MADETDDRRVAWLVRAGGAFVRALGATWRVRVTNAEGWLKLRAQKQPVIFVLWHGSMLPLLLQHRGQDIVVLISEHGDGEIIARIATSLGFGTVRGSTSRGAARALLELVRVAKAGHDLAFTPDGPRGPAKSFAPGALIVAQRTGAPLVAVTAGVSSAWRLKSWDAFMIPRPFARIHVTYSDPIYIRAENAREASRDEEVERVRQILLSTEARANG